MGAEPAATYGGLTDLQLRIINFVLIPTAVLVTCFRLIYRWRSGRLWWEDAWIACATFFAVAFSVSGELLFNPTVHSRLLRVTANYTLMITFACTVWSARMSLLCTIYRITISKPLRRLLAFTGVAFLLCWTILIAQLFWVCEGETAWKHARRPQCTMGFQIALAQAITDLAADIILIVVPIKLIWRTRLPRPQKIRISAAFAATIGTSITSLVHAYYMLRAQQNREALAALLEISMSVIVANLNVLVALVARITAEPEPSSTSSEWTSGWTPPSYMHFRSYRSAPVAGAHHATTENRPRRWSCFPFTGRANPTIHRVSLSPEDTETIDVTRPKYLPSIQATEFEVAMTTSMAKPSPADIVDVEELSGHPTSGTRPQPEY